ncbi:hypothetical protein RCL_jg7556.t1 [Rhizophagus clarus]|uniref:Uncharacterized protein n=1 Tax=Rhizophagus clarus TaxID=94130 RepID=A0A8H3QF62_9GLOM|nr:hypothetical protein RCL_jg7556.t1 [Rhizophagus clarus]
MLMTILIYFREKIFPNYLSHIVLKYCRLHERQACRLQQTIVKYFLPHQTVLDEDLGLKEAKKSLIRSFTKSFENPVDQEKFDRMQIVFFAINGKYTD